MNGEEYEVCCKVTALPGFKWIEGMPVVNRSGAKGTIVKKHNKGRWRVWAEGHVTVLTGEWAFDVTAPAAAGFLLELVRQAYGDRLIVPVVLGPYSWCCSSELSRLPSDSLSELPHPIPTEIEALVYDLGRAPEHTPKRYVRVVVINQQGSLSYVSEDEAPLFDPQRTFTVDVRWRSGEEEADVVFSPVRRVTAAFNHGPPVVQYIPHRMIEIKGSQIEIPITEFEIANIRQEASP